ncbi:MAG TPA: branched-chain amino acid ABC transporter permease, partial [Candidatus Hodarchaeales archaeon]|nr:branched-chain amino acid ABC transporter permease [Candidatus Hodarchaeales archaeon]
GLNMTSSVMKFSNFAHAEFITLGMYSSWWVLQMLSYLFPQDSGAYWINNIFVHSAYAFLIVGLLGIISEVLVFERIRSKRASATTFVVASIGIGLIVRNMLSMVFSDFPEKRGNFSGLCPACSAESSFPAFLPDFLRQEYYIFEFSKNSPLWGTQSIRITTQEFYIIAIAIIVVVAVDFIFRKTKFGIAMRATADNSELSQVSGINTRRVIFYTWLLAGGITGFGASFLRANQPRFTSTDGFFLLLPLFSVMVLGGVGSFRGGVIAAVILAFARQATTILFSEFQKPRGIESQLNLITLDPGYANGIGFVILILILLFRPQGLRGTQEATRARV